MLWSGLTVTEIHKLSKKSTTEVAEFIKSLAAAKGIQKKEIINHFISTFMFRVKNSKPELTIRLCKDDIEIEVIKSEEYGRDFEEFNLK